MKERPILFSAPMVRAILAGTKTQTRRVVKPQPSPELLAEYAQIRRDRGSVRSDGQMLTDCLPCPFGEPGTKLWVRETWARDDEDGSIMYRADVGRDMNADAWEQGRLEGVPRYRWRPSIYMPRWASRITLKVTGVRVERLQDISEADCQAEGIESYAINGRQPTDGNGSLHLPAGYYRYLWEQINGPGSWEANPWCWCIEFRRVTSD